MQLNDDTEFVMALRNQDAAFCRRMTAAIESGRETCPIGVSRKPCTEKPILADGWKVPCVRTT
jgi:hypothetical protein